jgi:hypothetical protein
MLQHTLGKFGVHISMAPIVPIFFFRKFIQNPNKQNQKRIRHSIVRIMSYGLEFIQKSTFSFSPNYFNLVFPIFLQIFQIFFSTELFPSRGISNKKKELIKYVVPVVSYD